MPNSVSVSLFNGISNFIGYLKPKPNFFLQTSVVLRINFYLLQTFCPHLGSFFCVCCFFFHYVSAKYHLWPSSGDFTATSDRNAESCNRIPSNYCLP